MDVEVASPAVPYYERMDLMSAMAVVSEMVDEWSYVEDAHGYCHVRPALVRLLEGLEACGVALPRTAYRAGSGT